MNFRSETSALSERFLMKIKESERKSKFRHGTSGRICPGSGIFLHNFLQPFADIISILLKNKDDTSKYLDAKQRTCTPIRSASRQRF